MFVGLIYVSIEVGRENHTLFKENVKDDEVNCTRMQFSFYKLLSTIEHPNRPITESSSMSWWKKFDKYSGFKTSVPLIWVFYKL